MINEFLNKFTLESCFLKTVNRSFEEDENFNNIFYSEIEKEKFDIDEKISNLDLFIKYENDIYSKFDYLLSRKLIYVVDYKDGLPNFKWKDVNDEIFKKHHKPRKSILKKDGETKIIFHIEK